MNNKIHNLDDLAVILAELKKQNKKIVHCHGVFDLVHPGHIKHFESAKKMGDYLVVTITADKFVNKGPGRPIFNELLRAESLAAIQLVDYVSIVYHSLALEAIEAIKPNFYVKGQEYKNSEDDITGGIIDEKKQVEKFGGKLAFTEEIVFSSSKIINRFFDNTTEKVKDYLKNTRESIDFDKLLNDFENISKLKIAIIGEIILDEYTFVVPLGKASKSSTITAKQLDSELYAGGVLAIANHISNFVSEVKLISTYGNNFGKDYKNFISSKLNSNITFKGIYTPDRPTVLKRRFVDNNFKHKIFEVIEIEDSPLEEEINDQIISELKDIEKKYDLLLVADFGHGMINNEIVKVITSKNLFISINTQTNSANSGFNLLSKYSKCNYFSIDENEARLATHDKYSDINLLISQLIKQTQSNIASITLGVRGTLVASSKGDNAVAPVLSNQVVDTIGAGDAYLSITSLLAKNGNSPEEIAFVGNAVGAMAVRILGNKSYIEKVPLLKYLKTLLT